MWTQRDQVQAYQFLRRRLVSAVQTGDANNPVSPSRRLAVCYALGAVCALLVTAGFGMYGVLRPGASQDWRRPGQVIIEKETGAAYVLGSDGLLHPVLNYASAKLLAGGGTTTVSARSLAGAARGAPLGIPGAPDSLPSSNRLVTGPWTVCAQAAPDHPDRAPATTTAIIGHAVAGTAVPPAAALIVADPTTGNRYAIVDGHRLRIRDTAAAVALGYDRTVPQPVAPAWLSAVPAGPDLAVISVPGAGTPGPGSTASQQIRVGEVLQVENVGSESRYYAVLSSGITAVSETEAALILGNPENGSSRPVLVSAGSIRQSATSRNAYPARVPKPVAPPGEAVSVCATSDGAVLLSDAPLPTGAKSVPAFTGTRDARTADAVYLRPSSGALISADPARMYLVTDQGVRYPVPSAEAARALGYGSVRPTPVTASFLALLPMGVPLDPAAAQRVAAQRVAVG